LGFVTYFGNGLPISNGYYYYWTDSNHNHHVDPGEIDINDPLGRFYNSIDPATLPNIPNQVQAGFRTPVTDEFTPGVDRQITEDFAASITGTYRNTTHLQDQIPVGTNLSTYDFLGQAAGSATGANGFTLAFSEPFYGLNLADTPTGTFFYNRSGASQRYWAV